MNNLFGLNEDAALDAHRYDNKINFISHQSETPNCTAKVISVCCVHHITMWAMGNIAVSKELIFEYAYQRIIGPDCIKEGAYSDRIWVKFDFSCICEIDLLVRVKSLTLTMWRTYVYRVIESSISNIGRMKGRVTCDNWVTDISVWSMGRANEEMPKLPAALDFHTANPTLV
ncbi:hypothetical protein JG687_00010380 [Phytophthora cactorum]|uniref:Uncharacterized protein n=1 Tax=Phytophthora cactorum TaxID=29920 RepID=A0A8T1U700_9STRA|nr:hypothetical protein JG687_00010380 [Phytophthora cactorum]